MSNATARVAPSSAWISTAVAGSSRSGLAVPRMIRSSSLAVTPARFIARRAASEAMLVSVSPSPQMCRWRMPVPSRIHSSEVSIPMPTNSSLRRIRFGTA